MAKSLSPLQVFDLQLKEVVSTLLEEHGFVRSGRQRLWVRESTTAKNVCQLIWFQIGESSSSLSGHFTVELGIYYPKYDRLCNRRALLGPVIGACHFDMRQRLGMFLPKPEDKWWPYSVTPEKLLLTIDKVLKLMTHHGLPWLTKADNPENEATYNTGKLPEPDRLRREAYERHQAGLKSS